MTRKRFSWFLIAVLALSLVLVACSSEPEEVEVEVTRVVTETETVVEEVPVEVEVEVTRIVTEVETELVVEEVEVEKAALGSEERPIQVLFLPSTEAEVIISGGDLLAEELKGVTGLNFEVSVPNSYPAVIEAMCASPDDTIGFISSNVYVLANERCGVQVGLSAVRFGWPVYWSQIVVRSDSGIETLEDLNGLTWGAPSSTSTSGGIVPQAIFESEGIVPSEIAEFGGSHTSAMLAVAQGDVDFATGFFSPPLLSDRKWNPEVDDPEIWRDAGEAPVRNPDTGRIFVAGGPDEGGYRLLDSRGSAMETYPTIFEETEILMISDTIPNDTLSYGADFPFNLATQISAAVKAYAESDACQEPADGVITLCHDDFYTWTGAEFAFDSDFDPTRFIIEALGLTEEDILG